MGLEFRWTDLDASRFTILKDSCVTFSQDGNDFPPIEINWNVLGLNITHPTPEAAMAKLYEYTVLTKETKDPSSPMIIVPAKVIVPIASIVAESEEAVKIVAARAIPDGVDLNGLEILVRLFK